MLSPILVLGTLVSASLLLPTPSKAQGSNLKELVDNLYGPTYYEASTFRSAPVWYNRADTFPELTDQALYNDPRFNVQVSELIASNVLTLAHDIGQNILVESQSKSEVFSPVSIYSALSLLLLGANGQTFDELMRLMNLDRDTYLAQNPWKIHEEMGLLLEDLTRNNVNPFHQRSQHEWKVNRGPVSGAYRNELSDYRISVANGLFLQTGFSLRPDYRSAVLGTYRSNIQNLDFERNLPESIQVINSWVNEKTEGRIPEIISDQLSSQTKVVLASALYFNAMWEKTFLEGHTGPKDFFPEGLSNAPIQVEMMANGGRFPFYDSKEYDCRIIGLPYKYNLTTMFVILPNNSNRGRLRQMQEYLTAARIEDMISKMEWKTAILLLPKLHISNSMNLKEVFKSMGLNALFQPYASDLSLISNGFGAAVEHPVGQSFVPPPTVDLSGLQDRYVASLADEEDSPFIFSRHGEDDEDQTQNSTVSSETPTPKEDTTTTEAATSTTNKSRSRRSVSYKVPSESKPKDSPLRLKDFIISKRVVKPNKSLMKKNSRSKRQIDLSLSLKQLDGLRNQLRSLTGGNPGLFADDIVHKVDLTVNEKGTEGGAATVTTLYRTGTDVVMRVETPFMFLIRHDETKLPLFYGTVYEP